MDDKELLELAAKAAGYDVEYGLGWNTNNLVRRYGRPDGLFYYSPFNPLEDDGDALRLAVDLKLIVRCYEEMIIVDGEGSVAEEKITDRHASTRRAIVRAAAEIGRAME